MVTHMKLPKTDFQSRCECGYVLDSHHTASPFSLECLWLTSLLVSGSHSSCDPQRCVRVLQTCLLSHCSGEAADRGLFFLCVLSVLRESDCPACAAAFSIKGIEMNGCVTVWVTEGQLINHLTLLLCTSFDWMHSVFFKMPTLSCTLCFSSPRHRLYSLSLSVVTITTSH